MCVWGPASADETGIGELKAEYGGRVGATRAEVGELVAAGVGEPGGVLAADALKEMGMNVCMNKKLI